MARDWTVDDVDLDTITPQQFAELVKDTDDDALRELCRTLGTDRVLQRILGEVGPLYRGGADEPGTLGFHVSDGDDTYDHAIVLADGSARFEAGRAQDPRGVVVTDFVPFAKLITKQASETMLFVRGKLKVKGDLMWARDVLSKMDLPKA